MAFSDHKIAAFTHKITDLPDQPNLPADELKARFDSSPEELRQAHNALCDDADRLDDRVSGIIAETFGDTISKSMLSDELQDEIDAKAEAADLTAETTARESADTALDTRVDALEEAMPEKIEMYYGQYNDNNGGNSYVTVTLPFTPKAVLVFPNGDGNARMITPTQNAVSDTGYICGTLDGNKLQVRLDLTPDCTQPHHFLALK